MKSKQIMIIVILTCIFQHYLNFLMAHNSTKVFVFHVSFFFLLVFEFDFLFNCFNNWKMMFVNVWLCKVIISYLRNMMVRWAMNTLTHSSKLHSHFHCFIFFFVYFSQNIALIPFELYLIKIVVKFVSRMQWIAKMRNFVSKLNACIYIRTEI